MTKFTLALFISLLSLVLASDGTWACSHSYLGDCPGYTTESTPPARARARQAAGKTTKPTGTKPQNSSDSR
jgi:hypothetical protein